MRGVAIHLYERSVSRLQVRIMPPGSNDDASAVDIVHLVRERDLYRQLLDLGGRDEIKPFLEEALGLIVELSGARRAYIELRDEADGVEAPGFWIARGFSEDDVAGIRARFSQGVIAEAVATRRTVVAASARNDPRFKDRGSVQEKGIEAILCAPIGVDPPLGVLYLQDRDKSGPFTEDDRLRAETFARHLSAFADRLLTRHRRQVEDDKTVAVRRGLRADGVIGRSAELARVLEQAAQVAPHNVTVLITGPCGTGKTQLARVIHENSRRHGRPFIEVNCAALPEALIENELFGAEPGAHSTATRKIEGKVTAAEGGTLFLDEIGELTLGAQATLLRLLQSKEYSPLGSTRTFAANVRVIAATNVDLKTAVLRHEFREDLLFRLQVMPIRIPALAERREDIGALAHYFCQRAVEDHELANLRISPGALRAIEAAEWPGNIRELANAVSAAALRSTWEQSLVIEHRHVFPEGLPGSGATGVRLTYQQATRLCQERCVRDALETSHWNVAEAAKLLDVTRAHVYNLIRAFALDRAK